MLFRSTPFPSRERGRKDWWAVCRVKSQSVYYVLEEKEECFQMDKTLRFQQSSIDAKLDASGILVHDGPYEEVDLTDFILKDNPIQEEEERLKEE